MPIYCVDDRHGTPCPQPPNADRCDACAADGCDSSQVIEADTPKEAARAAGWSEEYIAAQNWSMFQKGDRWIMDTIVHYHVEAGVGRPAINVKVRAPGAAFWPDDLEGPFDTDRAANIVETAYQRIASDFWQAASEIATQRGLGEITQEGRSGGWLVFMDGRDPQDAETFCGEHPDGPTLDDREAVSEWLAGYRSMVEWADAFIADAPRKVRDLAQQYAMDEAGEAAARRMFAYGPSIPAATWAYEGGAPRTAFTR